MLCTMPKPAKTICNCAVYRRNQLTSTLRTSESIETLVCVTDERQAGGVLVVSGLRGLCPVSGAVVVLVNLVDGEVLCIHVRLQLGLEGRTNTSQTIPRDTTEEWVLPDLAGTTDAA